MSGGLVIRASRIKSALGGAGLALLAACGAEAPAESRVQVRIESPAGVDTAFHATVAWADGRIDALACPAGASNTPEGLECRQDGFEVAGSQEFEVMVRSRGRAFSSTRIDPSAGKAATIHLEPLALAESTADYATRLDGDGCSESLLELALTLRTDLGQAHSVKFHVRDLQTAPRVYFQNTQKYPLHFDFARRVLGYAGSADQFAADTYAGAERSAMAGTLIFYPSVSGAARGAAATVEAPWTLNFFPSDAITTDQVRQAHRLIEERLSCLQWAGSTRRLVYVPANAAGEELASADDLSFRRSGIAWMSHQDLYGGISVQALNDGLALGTLRRMTPEQLASSVVSFRDVLVLTRLPNELPIVGGTITEEFQTPLAHVNVAARTRGTPNLAYPGAAQDPQITSLIGARVRFEVSGGDYSLREATLEEAEAFWGSRTRERFVPVFDSTLSGIPSFDQIGFSDSIRVGAKAANLAELSRELGEHAPAVGLAIPFRYYEEFLQSSLSSRKLCEGAQASCVASGRDDDTCQRALSLCVLGEGESFATFLGRVLEDPAFKEETVLRDAVLANVRYFIEQTPVSAEFAELLDARVAEVFGALRVKIRSSTNTEDLPNFSGAGLYNSYRAYATGAEAASRVVTRVFASTWSFRAFEERSFWNIDHQAVRMGCVINEAFSDELANGVLITQNIADPSVYGMYVNVQKGEESVTNPSRGALPEIFTILGDAGYEVSRDRFSSLSPSAALLSDSEVASLYEAGAKARAHFAKLYGRETVLEIEFKLTPQHQIVFKQARPYTTNAH